MAEAAKTVKKRNGNIELLRLLSMLMVISLHTLGKGENLVNLAGNITATTLFAWLLESFSIVAVNTFMLISGYFLVNAGFKLERLIGLVFQTVFYSLGVFLVCSIAGLTSFSGKGVYELLTYIFPIHMGTYWFVTAYLVVYILSPVLNRAAKELGRNRLGAVIIMLLVYECLIKSLLPVRLEMDTKGYDVLWFLIVYMIGAYFRLYGFKNLTSAKKGAACYLISACLLFGETVAVNLIVGYTGHLSEIKGIPMEYNHVFNILAAVGLFAAFINKKPMEEKSNAFVAAFSPMALGIYLLHESPVIRYEWQRWLGVYEIYSLSLPAFLLKYLLAVIVVFLAGILVDYIRISLFSFFGKAFANTGLVSWIKHFDGMINKFDEQKQ